jgi:hypothetical protein
MVGCVTIFKNFAREHDFNLIIIIFKKKRKSGNAIFVSLKLIYKREMEKVRFVFSFIF